METIICIVAIVIFVCIYAAIISSMSRDDQEKEEMFRKNHDVVKDFVIF